MMRRIFAIAALVAGALSVAPVPTLAAPIPGHCLVLPLLKAECRAAIADATADNTRAASSTVRKAVDAGARATRRGWLLGCRAAQSGTGRLLDC